MIYQNSYIGLLGAKNISHTLSFQNNTNAVFVSLPLQVMKGMAKIMKECWYESSAARLPALRVKKSLINLKCTDPVEV